MDAKKRNANFFLLVIIKVCCMTVLLIISQPMLSGDISNTIVNSAAQGVKTVVTVVPPVTMASQMMNKSNRLLAMKQYVENRFKPFTSLPAVQKVASKLGPVATRVGVLSSFTPTGVAATVGSGLLADVVLHATSDEGKASRALLRWEREQMENAEIETPEPGENMWNYALKVEKFRQNQNNFNVSRAAASAGLAAGLGALWYLGKKWWKQKRKKLQ